MKKSQIVQILFVCLFTFNFSAIATENLFPLGQYTCVRNVATSQGNAPVKLGFLLVENDGVLNIHNLTYECEHAWLCEAIGAAYFPSSITLERVAQVPNPQIRIGVFSAISSDGTFVQIQINYNFINPNASILATSVYRRLDSPGHSLGNIVCKVDL